jgi:hypothetical protein
MSKFSVITNVAGGLLQRNRKVILDVIKSFEGKELEIIFQSKKKTRSNPQNAYYWGVLIPLLCDAVRTEWGEYWDSDKAHKTLSQRFLFTEKYNEDTGEIMQIPKGSSECSTAEFEQYTEQCRRFLLEWFNVNAPLPNEQITLL